jgi:hypothetical protein
MYANTPPPAFYRIRPTFAHRAVQINTALRGAAIPMCFNYIRLMGPVHFACNWLATFVQTFKVKLDDVFFFYSVRSRAPI